MSVWSGHGILVAVYDPQASTPVWTLGGSTTLMAGQILVLSPPPSESLYGQGDGLYLHLEGGFGGTTVLSLP